MTSATIKLFLPQGDAKRLRVGEVSNWTGKALAAPRTELEDLLAREELESSGVYFLLGVNAETGANLAYIGEAEVIRDRLKQHKAKDFWNSVVVFVSKDENLTKAHIRYLENRLLQEAKNIGRYVLENSNSSNPKLPRVGQRRHGGLPVPHPASAARSRLRSTLANLWFGQTGPSAAPTCLQDQERPRSGQAHGRRVRCVCPVLGCSRNSSFRGNTVSEHGRIAPQAHSRRYPC